MHAKRFGFGAGRLIVGKQNGSNLRLVQVSVFGRNIVLGNL